MCDGEVWGSPDPEMPSSRRAAGLAPGEQQSAEVLLGHYCAILTSLALSRGGRLLATADKCVHGVGVRGGEGGVRGWVGC